ncbi:MAG: SGNH/GDSL hydrolase family protein [Desulfobacteraceae bacterium]|jgi:phospholipase/lecithinase/hemolysin
MKKRTVLPVILVLLLCLPTAALASNFDTLVVFGDSLTDNGNLFAIDPDQVPSDYYYQGRFSNGPVWAEYLAQEDFLNCTLVNNAYVGATTDGASPPGLLSQVSAYTNSASVEDNTLFAIWIGANDFLNGSVDYATSAANIRTALESLATFGAEHILILNLPDLGSTPRYLGTADEDGATALSQGFNEALAAVIDAFQGTYQETVVYEFDVYTFLQATADDPGSYGFTNAKQVCPSYATAGNFDNSAGYVFWDDIHPTTEAHDVIADQILSIVTEEDDIQSNVTEDDATASDSCFINSLFAIN